MQKSSVNGRDFRFGPFSFVPGTGELLKNGIKIRLNGQAVQVLTAILENAGQLISREELRSKLWSEGTFVDFDHSLNAVVNRLRQRLGDSAESPCYIETIPGRGYRFIAPVSATQPAVAIDPAPEALVAVLPDSVVIMPSPARSRRWMLAAGVAATSLLAAIVWRPWERPSPSRGVTTLAVLPFENLSTEPEQEFFAGGIHQQLIIDLSKIRALRVISRTSVMRYRGTIKPAPEIARELAVDAMVEGSVMHSGNKIRITAQLIRARTGENLWAESYDRDLTEVLELQREVARTIAGAIQITVTPQEKAWLAAAGRVDPEVYQLVLRGQYWADKGGEENLNKAIAYFQQAIGRDPTYAPAHAGLAVCYTGLATAYRPPREVMPKAKAAARRALELDETLVDAHVTLAHVLLYFDWDWPAAEEHLKRAVGLSPSDATAHIVYGSYFRALGQPQRALTEDRLAQTLDPLSLTVQTQILFSLIAARQFDDVIAQAHRTLEREPNFAWGYAFAALAYGEKGEFDQAIEAMEKATKIEPNTTFIAFSAHVQAAKGNRSEAERLLAELKAVSSRRYVCAYEMAHAYVKLRDKQEAFKWLERGKRERADCMVWLLCEPWMDPIRADRRYRELIEHIGLTGKAASKP